MTSLPSPPCPRRPAPVETGRGGVSLYGLSIEYGLHCLIWLADGRVKRASSRDLAEMQGVSPAMLSKIMPRLEKAGIVTSVAGIAGGYALACAAEDISVLDVVDAIEGGRRLFECREVRRGCTLFDGSPPIWSAAGVCGIHALMLRAENRMRAELSATSLADLARGIRRPPEFEELAATWFEDRTAARETVRITAVRRARRKPRPET
jgi:Rrf2 family protein